MRGDTWTIRIRFSDIETVCDGAASTSAPTKITSATAAFASDNLDQSITLAGAGAGGADYSGRITAIDSATQVTVCPSIKTPVSGGELTFGTAVDITANRLYLTLKESNDDADPGAAQFQNTMPANADSAAGIGFIVCPSNLTAAVTPKVYNYDIQRVITGAPPTVQTPVYGTMEVLQHTTVSVV